MPNVEWVEPTSLDDARTRHRVLIAEIEDIETQLGDPRRKESMSREDFHAWRQSAKWARVTRLQQKRLLKEWMQSYAVVLKKELATAENRQRADHSPLQVLTDSSTHVSG